MSCHKHHFCRDKLVLVATKHVFCRDKSMLAATQPLSGQNYVCRDRIFLSRQNFCRDKHTFVATKCLPMIVFTSSSLLPWSLVCSWTSVDHMFVLAVWRSGYPCSVRSAVWFSRPQLQVGAGYIFLNMYLSALKRFCPVRSLMTATYCHRSRKRNK